MIITTLNGLIEALREAYPINKVLVSNTHKDRKIDTIIDLCRKNRVLFQFVPLQAVDRKAGPGHQGVFAEISPVQFYTLTEILADIKTGLLLILDSINDTGNMGAIIRTAAAAAVDGIIFSQRNAAPINETVLKTSAGSVLKVRLAPSKNLRNDIELLKQDDFWIVGADKSGTIPYYEYDFSYKTALIVGNEHKGISPLLKKNADQLVFIPHAAEVESLNVSAAAAITLFEALRQRAGNDKRKSI
ncbi:MAG: 23S rRNA (guanosine(2251)-2'-O)-methyltransferase RlmB [Candidatus Aminicenantes bacterium]|nr:23S rRNA (guanosine(2251)-2'-O)-methyltransferase RlmB [Candidatus Aminicenantes bacterium]